MIICLAYAIFIRYCRFVRYVQFKEKFLQNYCEAHQRYTDKSVRTLNKQEEMKYESRRIENVNVDAWCDWVA